MKRCDDDFSETGIFLDRSTPKISCELIVDQSGIQNEKKEAGQFLKITTNNRLRRPPLKRGISRNNSDTNLLPVANVLLIVSHSTIFITK